jgi:hypothetical protein
MAKPKSLSVKLVMDDEKQLTITYDVVSWEDLKEDTPGFYHLFRDWAEHDGS